MQLNDIGEFGLIHRIAPRFLKNLRGKILGIGDDCAVIPRDDGESLLVTTDLLIEDIHFLLQKISARDLGHKSLAVNLSDIAAMGGTPIASFLSIGLPKGTSIDWLDDFFAGLDDLSQRFASPLLGGDTTSAKSSLVINIAVLGKGHPDRIKYRSDAQPDDVICVTDSLGDSVGGLRILLNDLEDPGSTDMEQLIQAHHRPIPHLPEGEWLAKHDAVHAMMDVSDGIDSDIRRIMEESAVGARVDIENIPVSDALKAVSDQLGWNPREMAATGGEDYCLLCTIAPSSIEQIGLAFQQQFNRPLFRIGVIEKTDALIYHQNNEPISLAEPGWEHFK